MGTVYIAGPMRGIKDFNYPAFNAAAARLRSLGLEVVNPAEVPGDADRPFADCMRIDVAAIAFGVDAVVVLPGWENSKGATCEVIVAKTLGLDVLTMKGEDAVLPNHVVQALNPTAALPEPAPPAPRPLIGLVGHKGAGKDTVAAILVEKYGYRQDAFANALKEEVYGALSRFFGPEQTLETWLRFLDCHKHDGPRSDHGWARPLLQSWGTEYRRKLCGEDYWLDKVSLGEGVVVSDVRFPNEAAAIKKAGGVLWEIMRPGYEGDGHASEVSVDLIETDLMIVNIGPLRELPSLVDLAMKGLS